MSISGSSSTGSVTLACPTCAILSLTPTSPQTARTKRVEDLLNGYALPLDVETAQFRLIVDHSADVFADLDQKIATTRDALAKLVRARELAVSHVEDARSMLHPIRMLPSELLSSIFEWCVPAWSSAIRSEDDDDESYQVLKPSSPPWTLSHVCRRWRSLAISQPSLWTFLRLQFQAMAHLSPQQLQYKMALLLNRSGTQDLSVVLNLGENNVQPPFRAVAPILQASMFRWRRLCFNGSTATIQSFSENTLPRLIELRYNDDPVFQEIDCRVTLFEYAPALRRLELGCMAGSVLQSGFPWTRLTEYLCQAEYDICNLKSLACMTSLQTLSLTLHGDFDLATFRIPLLDLPRLSRLCLVESSQSVPGAIQKFTSSLRAPLLHHLLLSYPNSRDWPCHFPVFSSSLSSLRRFDIDIETSICKERVTDLCAFLFDIPDVEYFRLYDSAIPSSFFRQMANKQGLLPRLRTLEIAAEVELVDDRDPGDALLCMLESRCGIEEHPGGACQLRELMIEVKVELLDASRWKNIQRSLTLGALPDYEQMEWFDLPADPRFLAR